MPLQARKILFSVCTLYYCVTLTKSCLSAPWELSGFQQELSQLNGSSPVEPSGARSPGRISLSTGLEVVSLNQNQASNLQIFPEEAKISKGFLSWSQGLFYPLSLGASFATVTTQIKSKKSINQLSANLKWTIFESFGLPAVSAYLQWSRTFGLDKYDLQSSTGNLQASWGYKRLSLYSGLSLHHHQLKLQEVDQKDSSQQPTETFNHLSTQLGGQLQIIPAKLAFSIENAKTSFSNLYRAKLSYEF